MRQVIGRIPSSNKPYYQFTVERIGDFEFESMINGLGIYMASMDVAKEEEETKTTPAGPRAIIPEPARNPPPPLLIIQSYRQPPETVPSDSPIEERSFTEALMPAAEDNTTGSSTTATTPDMCVPKEQSSFSNLSALAEDADDGESKILEKSCAHELLHNKEGQVTAGILPALVERLTQHTDDCISGVHEVVDWATWKLEGMCEVLRSKLPTSNLQDISQVDYLLAHLSPIDSFQARSLLYRCMGPGAL